jgi:hypothetical protein
LGKANVILRKEKYCMEKVVKAVSQIEGNEDIRVDVWISKSKGVLKTETHNQPAAKKQAEAVTSYHFVD